ncbi:MAG: ABC transporter ATP-binding protein [bacterium]|nr:ABC transporter ATP-binding protein [bacterium]
MASITLKQLRRHFGTVKAVDQVDLRVEDGQFVALLGPSGCGKTTTLRMIAGLELPDGGRIDIGAKDVTRLAPRDRDIAMVFQDYALYPHMTVAENVGYPLKVRGTPGGEIAQRVRNVAERLQIAHLLERRPAQLSGGQQQRVALARAVVYPAQATLYDEPLSNLDTKLRLEARAFLKHLQQEVGVTSIYVTHDQAEAMALADLIVVMSEGRIMQVGSPKSIYQTPQNTFVAGFIGSPPMNLIDGVMDRAARMLTFAGGASMTWERSIPPAVEGAVTVGIRPEYVTVCPVEQPGAVPAALYVTQMLGGESLVVTRVGDQFVSVRLFTDEVPPLPPHIGLCFDPARMFFYGADGRLLV